MKCHCCSALDYKHCCEPFILGEAIPTTPEQLMRSRYSAFCEKNADYLLATHKAPEHEGSENTVLEEKIALEQSFQKTYWRGLKILNSGAQNVEFVAFCSDTPTGTVSQLHEHSQFIHEEDRWYYTHGEQLPPIKLGRNDSCFCCSGKKYKKCCDA